MGFGSPEPSNRMVWNGWNRLNTVDGADTGTLVMLANTSITGR